jgi:hypothetical protein
VSRQLVGVQRFPDVSHRSRNGFTIVSGELRDDRALSVAGAGRAREAVRACPRPGNRQTQEEAGLTKPTSNSKKRLD